MGGGDLNLKKSWHPSTLRNIERVWKAEQKHEVEKQKIEQLQKELAAERAREEIQAYAEDQGVVRKRDERLDWMYQGPAAMVSRDDYLLGRKIDKTLELLEQQETGVEPPKEESRIGSIFSQTSSENVAVDLANKIREDPLFSIMKQEKEQRKNLLTNPVKMKQLQEILKASLGKSKKSKKSKKKRRQRSCSESSSDSEKHSKKRKQKSISVQSSHSEFEGDKYASKDRSKEYSKNIKRSADYDDHNNGYKKRGWNEHKQSNLSLDSRHRYSDEKYDHRERRTLEGYSKDAVHHSIRRGDEQKNKRQLDAKEKERRLKEMQENAKWREEQRKRNSQRFQEEAEKEDHFQRVDTSEFLRPMLSKTAGKGTLENRVKQKIFTIQRNNSDMNKHFARR